MPRAMIFFRILRYIEYLLFARHRKGQGIHSPYVFDLVTRVFRNKTDHQFVLTIESMRKKNISDNRTIEVLDLGAGSSRLKTNSRKVSEIARYSAVPEKYGLLLSNLAAEYGNKPIIEFGTSLGISTMYLAAGSHGSIVYTMEGCPQTASVAAENFSIAGFDNIKLMRGSFDDLLSGIRRQNINPGLVFIDGNHHKEPVCRYFREICEISNYEAVIVIDDIHYSREMEAAWDEIKAEGSVTLTIDIFRMGLVLTRRGMGKCNYIVRY